MQVVHSQVEPMSQSSSSQSSDSKPSSLRSRLILLGLGLFVVAIFAALFFGQEQLAGLETTVIEGAQSWAQWVRDNVLIYALLFTAAYAAISVLGLPLSVVFSLGGGAVSALAFGFWPGTFLSTVLVWIAVTGGSWGLFEFVKRYGSGAFDALVGPYVERFRQGFEQDQFFYMLASRFTPVPPAVTTVVPALLNANRRSFLMATGLGFLPGVFVYASLGAKLGDLIAQRGAGEELGFGDVVTLGNTWPLLALLALSIVPILVKRFNSKDA